MDEFLIWKSFHAHFFHQRIPTNAFLRLGDANARVDLQIHQIVMARKEARVSSSTQYGCIS